MSIRREDLPEDVDRFLYRFSELMRDFGKLHYVTLSLDELADDPYIGFCLCGWETSRSGDRSVVEAEAEAHAGQ